MTDPKAKPEGFFETLDLQGDSGIAPPKASLARSKSGEMLPVYAVMILLGITAAFYAIRASRRANSEVVAVPSLAPTFVAPPEPIFTEPDPSPRVSRFSPTPATRRIRVTPLNVPPRIVNEAEPPAMRAVDPVTGFESGEAFDNPTTPSRFGQRTSGLLERGEASNRMPPESESQPLPRPRARRKSGN